MPSPRVKKTTLSYQPNFIKNLINLTKATDLSAFFTTDNNRFEIFSCYPAEYIIDREMSLSTGVKSPNQNTTTDTTNDLSELTVRLKNPHQAHVKDDYNTETINLINTWLSYLPAIPELNHLPFQGGLIGYLGYPNKNNTPNPLPSYCWGFYTHGIIIDHHLKTITAFNRELSHRAPEPLKEAVQRSNHAWEALMSDTHGATQQHFTLTTPFQSLTAKNDYIKTFLKIKQYLENGDCYQVNYAQKFSAQCSGSSSVAFFHLKEQSQAQYAAFLSYPFADIMSLSPELLLTLNERNITTKPIKGTSARHPDRYQDALNAHQLQESEKNRAENIMIVDLLRNDLGRIANTGSVKVEHLFAIESLPNVHHLVSTVQATLQPNISAMDALHAIFPGGSITGAPKKRAMEIIDEIEPFSRQIYCGSIGFINADGNAQFNIAIRTLLRVGNEIITWAGSGIVMDSDVESEYKECFDKIQFLMSALAKFEIN